MQNIVQRFFPAVVLKVESVGSGITSVLYNFLACQCKDLPQSRDIPPSEPVLIL